MLKEKTKYNWPLCWPDNAYEQRKKKHYFINC